MICSRNSEILADKPLFSTLWTRFEIDFKGEFLVKFFVLQFHNVLFHSFFQKSDVFTNRGGAYNTLTFSCFSSILGSSKHSRESFLLRANMCVRHDFPGREALRGVLRLLSVNMLRYMAKKLYVGGLPYSTTEEELRAAFSEAGAVLSARIIIDRMTNRSRGFGFVEFENDADADKAIETFDGKEFGGRTLVVNEARPLEER